MNIGCKVPLNIMLKYIKCKYKVIRHSNQYKADIRANI